jgi:hypothetical protein
LKIVPGNRLAEKIVALFRTIPAKCLPHGEFGNCFLHRLDNGGRKRFRHVTNSKPYDLSGWILLSEGVDTTSDLGKEISSFQLQIMVVDPGHGISATFAIRVTGRGRGKIRSPR